MIQPIIEHITYPIWQWYNGYSDLSILRQLRQREKLKAADVKELQFKRLKELLLHAYQTVPFYRKRFDTCGFSVRSFSDLSELKRIPILTKAEINKNLDAMISTSYAGSRLIPNSTGGSTGVPLNFLQNLEKKSYIRAVTLRENLWLGCRPGDKIARLWGSGKDLRGAASFKFWLGNTFVRRTVVLDAFQLDEIKIHEFLAKIESFRPKIIIAYAGAAYFVARYAERRSIRPFSPSFLIATAETLHEEHRVLIERVFKTKVINRYASREIGQVASGCGVSPGLHINEDCVLVELLPLPGRSSEAQSGRIIITDLTHSAMPMIRYDTEDVGVLDSNPCPCGLPFSKLKTVEGRVSDLFLTPDGTYVHSEYFSHLFYGMRGVKNFQIIQEALDLIRVNIVKEDALSENNVSKIADGIKSKMGETVRVEFVFSEAIEQGRSGKHRFTISRVTSAEEQGIGTL